MGGDRTLGGCVDGVVWIGGAAVGDFGLDWRGGAWSGGDRVNGTSGRTEDGCGDVGVVHEGFAMGLLCTQCTERR